MSKLKSRKLWVTVLTSAFITLAAEFGIDEATVEQVVYIVVPYLIGQSAIDYREVKYSA